MERKKLTLLRKTKELSQLDMAILLNKDVSAYNRMESGLTQLTEEDMLQLCHILECRLQDLVEEESLQSLKEENRITSFLQKPASKDEETLLSQLQKIQQMHVARIDLMMREFSALIIARPGIE